MKTVTIHGQSDDLIEIEGDIEQEFMSAYEDDEILLIFSDGTVLRVKYDKGGVWRITKVVEGAATMTKVEAPEDDEDNYSDRVTLVGDLQWVAYAHDITYAKKGAAAEA